MSAVVWLRASVLVAAACGLSSGCGAGGPGASGRGTGSEPRAIVVAPAPPNATGIAGPDSAPPGDDAPPFELALDTERVCVRWSGKVHCASALGADVALVRTPPLEGVDDAVSLALGSGFGCAATRAGTVFCFGNNERGQLGARLRAERSEKPVPVAGITGAKRVIAGDAHACAVLGDGTVRCWGSNDSGQTGGSTSYLPPARELVEADVVERAKDVTTLAATASTTCAATRTHEVFCWGTELLRADAQMNGPKNLRPVVVPDLAGFDELTASPGAFCGVQGGEVKCWVELYALLPGRSWRSTKLASAGVTRARRLRMARGHACALLTDGAVTCWGSNAYGELGRGETSGSDALPPDVVKDLPPAVDIVVDGSRSCAVTANREVYCWGMWSRTDGPGRKEHTPVKVRIME